MVLSSRESSVSAQISLLHRQQKAQQHLISDPVSHGDLAALRQEVTSLRNRVVELEQQQEEMERDQRTARHMAALFEEYVMGWSREGNAIMKSHEGMKRQVESGEKLIVALAEKLINVVGKSSTKLKEFESIQKGHQNKLMDLDRGAREGLHKINQVKHMVEKGGGSTPKSQRRLMIKNTHGAHGANATHFASDDARFGEAEEHRLASLEEALETTREALLSNLREVKLEVDSVWGEIKRGNGEIKGEVGELESAINDMKEVFLSNEEMKKGFEQKQLEERRESNAGGSYSTSQQRLRKTVQRITIINAFAKSKLKANARKSIIAAQADGDSKGGGGGGTEKPISPMYGQSEQKSTETVTPLASSKGWGGTDKNETKPAEGGKSRTSLFSQGGDFSFG